MQLQNKALIDANPPRRFVSALADDGILVAAERLSLTPDDALTQIFAAHQNLAATLNSCARHAPFLRDLLCKHHAFIADVAREPVQSVIASILSALDTPSNTQLALRQTLRQTRQKLMLYLALADCGNIISLFTLTRALSDLADRALNAALTFELAQLAQRGDFDTEHMTPETCGLAILGLGKLGGYELNYSSDIDLMVYFEPDRFGYRGRKDVKEAAVQLSRTVCGHLSAKTSGGFVFRVDLRLRPDPGSTPIAISLDAAEAYYQSAGLTWERAALIKARHSAGDPTISSDFLERVRPFVWRKHLDFAAIDDVHAMKNRVHEHHGHDIADKPGPGYDVKLGRGGIREIEFFAQIHQLIAGGKRPDLQASGTCDVLRALTAEGDIPPWASATLIEAYDVLRATEHRLQMIADAQTHSLPEGADLAAHHAHLSGYDTPEQLYAELNVHTAHVRTLFADLLADPDETPLDIPEVYAKDSSLQDKLKRWRSKQYRALKSERSLQLLESVLPDILAAFAETPSPDETLNAFDTFIGQLPAGVQIFSLLSANRSIIALLASVMGQSLELRNQVARRPSLFDGLLSGDLQTVLMTQTALREDLDTALTRARGFEGVLDIIRIWNGELRFKTGVQLLEGVITPTQTAQAYTDIAEVCVSALYERVTAEFEAAHGVMPGGAFVVVALGSFGARELVTSSDLDLTFVYDVASKDAGSNGAKPLKARDYYTRLSQRVITAITSMTGEGRLYEVDMRLRPSGRSGIIAVSLDAFSSYHQDKAWLWERMSLTKARPVAGHASLIDKFRDCRKTVLSSTVPAEEVRAAVWDMRARLRSAEKTPPSLWSLKTGDGGLTDADFLVEGLILENSASLEGLEDTVMWPQWLDALSTAGVIPGTLAGDISNARDFLLSARIAKSLLMPKQTTMDRAPQGAQAKFSALIGVDDFAAAEKAVDAAQIIILKCLKTLLVQQHATHDDAESETAQRQT